MDNPPVQNNAAELLSRAKAIHSKVLIPENSLLIREILTEALQNPADIDPSLLAEAWSLYGEILMCDYLNRWNDAGSQVLSEAENAIERALQIDPDLASANYASGLVYRAKGKHQRSLAAFTKTIALNPNLLLAQAQQGAELMYTGRLEEALRPIEAALNKSRPDSPSRGMYYWYMGRVHFFANNYREAIPCLKKSVQLRPTLWYNRLYLVSAYSLIGSKNKAKAELSDFAARFPGYTLARVVLDEQTNPNDNAVVVTGRKAFHQGLRDAGMSET